MLARYRVAIGGLEGRGVRISSTSRLRLFESLLAEVVDDARPYVEVEFANQLSFALRDIDEIAAIVASLPEEIDGATRLLLSKLPAGAAFPDDEAGSFAREAQYELFLGLVARSAGFEVAHGKPDLTIWDGDIRLSLEAKRPSSGKRVDDRVRVAVRQLRRVEGARLMAISFDEVARDKDKILVVRDNKSLGPVVKRLLVDSVAQHAHSMQNRLRGSAVAALLISARVPARIESTGHTALGTGLHVQALVERSHPAVVAIERLSVAYTASLGASAT
jgi:hypothetical protein